MAARAQGRAQLPGRQLTAPAATAISWPMTAIGPMAPVVFLRLLGEMDVRRYCQAGVRNRQRTIP
jgi:hypothetical protein